MERGCGRRTFLKLVAAGGAAASLPGWLACNRSTSPPGTRVARFFQPEEWTLIESLADAILPGERGVGAVSAGAVEYIDRFLAAFGVDVAGGTVST